ncbi:DUF4194 domain-containing protein [Dyella amyloliquefaciens]|uniref:DUF4194 domain-containing protein n=1 Tax=Dyella amyloliquefaciens TaxID=1770545 RepID=UPI00102E28E6|nr:DUF4194 domain-containing protein [Dyella amyloliquefaciens]
MANWERLAEQNPHYVAGDYESAGYRLLLEQVLYASDRRSRTAYDLVVKHLGAYRELLGQLGVSILHNAHMSYLVALPNQAVAEKMRLSETRLALVLRRLYDDKMHATEVVAGEAFIDLIELERSFKELLGRELPDQASLRDQVDALKRYGIVRREDTEDEQPFVIVIRPGIVDVLGETALLQLAAYATAIDEEDASEAP